MSNSLLKVSGRKAVRDNRQRCRSDSNLDIAPEMRLNVLSLICWSSTQLSITVVSHIHSTDVLSRYLYTQSQIRFHGPGNETS